MVKFRRRCLLLVLLLPSCGKVSDPKPEASDSLPRTACEQACHNMSECPDEEDLERCSPSCTNDCTPQTCEEMCVGRCESSENQAIQAGCQEPWDSYMSCAASLDSEYCVDATLANAEVIETECADTLTAYLECVGP